MKDVQMLMLYSHSSDPFHSRMNEFSTPGINIKDIPGGYRKTKARKKLIAQHASGFIWVCLDLYYFRES